MLFPFIMMFARSSACCCATISSFLLSAQKKRSKEKCAELRRFLLRKTASVPSLQPANLLRKSAFRSVHRYRCNSGFLIGLFRQSRKDVSCKLTNLKIIHSIPLAGWRKKTLLAIAMVFRCWDILFSDYIPCKQIVRK